MVSKYLLIPALLSAWLTLAPDTELLARGGGGGGGRGGGGGYGGGGRGGYGGGYGRGGYGYGGYGYGGFGYGLGYGLGLGYYGGYPYSYGDYYPYPYAAPPVYAPQIYAPPIASAPAAGPANSYYYYAGPPAAPTADAANIHVVLPDPQATVIVDGRTTTSTGTERNYHTPPLASGGSYTYTLRVSWQQDGRAVTEERKVAVTPGRTTDVVFSRTDGVATSATK